MDNPIVQAEHAVSGWLHRNAEEIPVTDTTITTTDTAGTVAPAAGAPESFWMMLHANLTRFTAATARFLPHLEQIATNPRLDAAVEALFNAAGMGVEAEVFEFVTGALNNAAQRKAAAATPTADGTPASAGEQPAQTV
jgi:hypothetical protein